MEAQPPPPPPPPPPWAPGAEPAGLGRRTAAAVIDLMPLVGLFFVLAKAIGTWDTVGPSQRIELENGDFLLYIALVLGYYFAFEVLFARTPGKLVCGLRVVDASGAKARPIQVLNRTAMRFIDFLPVFYLVGFVAAAANERNARLGDRTAKTAVIAA